MSSPTATRPDPSTYHPFYADYVGLVPDGDVLDTLAVGMGETLALLGRFDEARAGRAYAEGKWTLKELVAHLVDAERVFAFRALSIARADPAPLPGMDQDVWADACDANERDFDALCSELELVRRANLLMFRGLSDAAWERVGTANDTAFAVRVVPWILAGHERHHRVVIAERYA